MFYSVELGRDAAVHCKEFAVYDGCDGKNIEELCEGLVDLLVLLGET